jgi:hypothetical protein
MWGKFFSPLGDPKWQIPVSFFWAPFFTAKLLQENSFTWAKSFLNSKAWPLIQNEVQQQDPLIFSLPFECPKAALSCSSFSTCHSNLSTPLQQSSASSELLPQKRKERQLMLVDTDLRRSSRLKASNASFKAVGCGKHCLGCDLDPPPPLPSLTQLL